MTKNEIIKFISEDKLELVNPLIEEIFNYYHEINVSFEDIFFSKFTRDVDFKNQPLAIGKIIISNSCNTETALIHELLHLHIPLEHDVYTLWFPGLYEDLKLLSDDIQNVIEHDLMLNRFLSFGYDISLFLKSATLNIDYKKDKKSDNNMVYLDV